MPHYYFHLEECGTRTLDEEGHDLPDYETAHSYAIEAARGLMSAEVAAGSLCLGCYIDIMNERGDMLGRARFRDAVTVSGL